MNPKVEEFLESERKEELKKRNEHLRSLGIVDDEKTVKKYYSSYNPGLQYDEEKRIYYKEMPKVIDVSDEEYAQICRYAPPQTLTELEIAYKTEHNVRVIKNILVFFTVLYILALIIIIIAVS